MKKIITSVLFLSVVVTALAQTIPENHKKVKFKLDTASWTSAPSNIEFVNHNNNFALHIKKFDKPLLYKNIKFYSGVIEYDIDPQDKDFCGIYFRAKNEENAEYFYLRMDAADKANWNDGIQYAPTIKGLTYWILMEHYQGAADFHKDKWNHIKLVVSGYQMLVYVNNMLQPALSVDRLEGDFQPGLIGFDGASYISNITIQPDLTQGLSPVAGLDPTLNDPRYLRNWKFTQPVDLHLGREPLSQDIPVPDSSWRKITTERRGLINFSRLYNRSQSRRLIWLKLSLRSPIDQVRYLDLGFSDEVWGFINKEIAFTDKNIYFEPIRKDPGGRVSVQNGRYKLPLKAGDNELVIGLVNNYFGWGLIARLDSMKGIEIVN